MILKIINYSDNPLPKYQTEQSAGMDLQAFIGAPITLKPLQRALIPTGLSIQLPKGYEAQIRARSGLSIKKGITVISGIGTIDSDYRGLIGIPIINLSQEEYTIHTGDRIAQMIVTNYQKVDLVEVKQLDATQRATGGFGHTGI